VAVVDRLTAPRGPAKGNSDVILRLVEMRWSRSLALHNPTECSERAPAEYGHFVFARQTLFRARDGGAAFDRILLKKSENDLARNSRIRPARGVEDAGWPREPMTLVAETDR
jgi:hypothetical protein